MQFKMDHDLHLHTNLSICSKDENQTKQALLEYAKKNNFNKICVTDHYWDDAVPCNTAVNWWYEKQNFDHIAQNLPLPKDDTVRFLFGCEADMDSDNRIGLPLSRYNDFDFIVVATTHFHHMSGGEWDDNSNSAVANRWIKRMYAVLDSNLPLHKVGIAHPVCRLFNNKSTAGYLETLNLITDEQLMDVFGCASKAGVGIEINANDFKFSDEEAGTVLRIFEIAKGCGCKFYLGSDAHYNSQLNNSLVHFERAVKLLNLNESDKFII